MLSQGKNVEIIPRSTVQGVKTADFVIDGVKTELKTLTNPNLNSGITNIQDAFQQNAKNVIIDARSSGISSSQAIEIIQRAEGSYLSKTLPGKVEIWISDGTIIRN